MVNPGTMALEGLPLRFIPGFWLCNCQALSIKGKNEKRSDRL